VRVGHGDTFLAICAAMSDREKDFCKDSTKYRLHTNSLDSPGCDLQFFKEVELRVLVIKTGYPGLCFATHLDSGLFVCIYFICAFTLLVRAIYWTMFLLPLAYKS